jgi:hypothetical protein
MKTASYGLSFALATAFLLVLAPVASGQHSASWKARGLPRTTEIAANYVGRSNADAGYNYAQSNVAGRYARAPQNVYAYNYAAPYRPAPMNYAAPPTLQPAPQLAAVQGDGEERRTFSAAPQDSAPAAVNYAPQPGYYQPAPYFRPQRPNPCYYQSRR